MRTIFLTLFATLITNCFAQKLDDSGLIDVSSHPSGFGSCFAIFRNEAMLKDPATQTLAIENSLKLAAYGNSLKSQTPRDYERFLSRANALDQELRSNKLNTMNDTPNKSFTRAFVSCSKLMQFLSANESKK